MKNKTFDPYTFEELKEEPNLKEVSFKYLSYWKWFVFSLILALIVAKLYLKLQMPQYNIQSSILINENKPESGQDDLIKQLNMFASDKETDNEIEILKSFTLMEKVVNTLHLNIHYFDVPPSILTSYGFNRFLFEGQEYSNDYYR